MGGNLSPIVALIVIHFDLNYKFCRYFLGIRHDRNIYLKKKAIIGAYELNNLMNKQFAIENPS